METALTGIDSVVLFHNSQGHRGRGTLVHITRSTVVFEVYNPYSIVQLSEVLQGVRVVRGERVIYNGKAVVSNLVSTGLMIIVSATLVDPWVDLAGLEPGERLVEETTRFVSDWQASHEIRRPYQVIVSTMCNFLAEFSRWVDEAEAGVMDAEIEVPNGLRDEFFFNVQEPVTPKLVEILDEFEEEAEGISEDEVTVHKAFARRQLHPYLMCSPFVHRTFTKPLGYAGDYEMVNMMLFESDAKAANTYARIVDTLYIACKAPEAHRNRIVMLEERLEREAARVVSEGRPFTVLNIGCGPAVEVQRFIRNVKLSQQTVFRLMDFNDETIQYADAKIQAAIRESGNKPMLKFIHKSIDTLLKEIHHESEESATTYDMVYCAGLFDYFSNQVCRQLTAQFYKWLKPGGLLTTTNVHPANPNRFLIEHLLEWHLIYRDQKDMKALAPAGTVHSVTADATGINVFLDIRKDE